MKFSVNWLREFVELPASIAELTETLTLAGVEIERFEQRGAEFEKVVVAQITASKPHPNADRLSVCQVNDGSGQTRQIVCGAKNYQVGDKVPLALPGALLPNDLKIRASKLRGVESEGMLCSAKELGIADDAAGLLILSPDAKIGAPIGDLFPADTILDVEITPNRSDLLSHYGLAREIAALTEKALRTVERETEGDGSAAEEQRAHSAAIRQDGRPPVQITAPRECPFYSARRITSVAVGSSPDWLRARLEAVGLRSINNIVDITNYVMLELGQPLHAFDADKLSGSINVRLAQEEEKFLALDGKTYSLGRDNLVIADNARAVAIAGVMGGEDTGVTASTRNVLIESAYFLPASVRRTARMLNLPSESSYRFERGVDPAMTLRASERATQLIRELAQGVPEAALATAGTRPENGVEVRLRHARREQYLGAFVAAAEASRILEQFGLKKNTNNAGETSWRIPSYRSDLRREEDLIEEIVRAYGINRIEGRDRSRFTPASAADQLYDSEIALRRRLIAQGLSEVRTSALVPRVAGASFAGSALQLRNPLSEEHVALRPSLVPGLLAVLARNVRGGARMVKLFEIGRTFQRMDGSEIRHLAIVFCGRAAGEIDWRAARPRNLDLFDLKGILDSVGFPEPSFHRVQKPELALAVELRVTGKAVGFVGQLHSAEATAADAQAPVFVAEVAIDDLIARNTKTPHFRELERFPAVTRDIAMIVPDALAHEEIVAVISGAREPLLERVELFDLFAGNEAASLGAGRKSLAYTLTYRDKNRTLTSDEVTAAHARIRDRLRSDLAVELRE